MPRCFHIGTTNIGQHVRGFLVTNTNTTEVLGKVAVILQNFPLNTNLETLNALVQKALPSASLLCTSTSCPRNLKCLTLQPKIAKLHHASESDADALRKKTKPYCKTSTALGIKNYFEHSITIRRLQTKTINQLYRHLCYGNRASSSRRSEPRREDSRTAPGASPV